MLSFPTNRVVSIGEAMVELAPEADGLYRQGFAGDTFNTVWHMGQLLAGRAEAGFVTTLGMDRFSDRFAADMARDGLDASGLMRSADHTMGLYLIELDGVERSFHYWRKDSAARRLADDAEALAQAIGAAGLIHVSGITLAILDDAARARLLAVLSAKRAAGAVISFDPNVRPRLWASPDACRAAIRDMLAVTDIALPSLDDERALWGDPDAGATIARMADAGVREIVVKDGAGPVHAGGAFSPVRLDTPPVTSIRDTTGAGDAFNAGYLAARLRGFDVADAVRSGQGLSGLVITCLGARAPREAVLRLGERL